MHVWKFKGSSYTNQSTNPERTLIVPPGPLSQLSNVDAEKQAGREGLGTRLSAKYCSKYKLADTYMYIHVHKFS